VNDPVWRKPSRSLGTGNCVETARLGRNVGVRDSKHVDTSPVLEFSQDAFRRFVAGVKSQ
jgi:Domain of unknown function (DUF397)